jgi:hypothetical protein
MNKWLGILWAVLFVPALGLTALSLFISAVAPFFILCDADPTNPATCGIGAPFSNLLIQIALIWSPLFYLAGASVGLSGSARATLGQTAATILLYLPFLILGIQVLVFLLPS